MKIIDVTYFSHAPHVIANAPGISNSAMSNAASKVIEDLMEKHHDSFLRDVLGDGAESVIEELDRVGSMEELGDEVKAIAEALSEPFGLFMYFQILRNSQSISGITGVYQLVTSDKGVSPRTLQTQCWNDMARQLRVLSSKNGWPCKCNLLKYVNPFNI